MKSVVKNQKNMEKFGRLKDNNYLCRRFDIKQAQNEKNSKLLVVAWLKIQKIVRR